MNHHSVGSHKCKSHLFTLDTLNVSCLESARSRILDFFLYKGGHITYCINNECLWKTTSKIHQTLWMKDLIKYISLYTIHLQCFSFRCKVKWFSFIYIYTYIPFSDSSLIWVIREYWVEFLVLVIRDPC